MKLRSVILLFLFLSCIGMSGTDLKIVWWNVNNFFDTVDDPETNDTVLSPEKYAQKLKLISEKISKMNADIVGLAEVENMTVVKDMASNTGYEYYYIKKGNDERGINIALLSKYKVEYLSHKNKKTPYKGNINYEFSRDCPEAVLNIDDKKIYLLLNHLKSRLAEKGENTQVKRLAQVNGILDIISDIYRKNPIEPDVIVMGDFNDNRHSIVMNNLEKSGLVIINYLYKEDRYYTMNYKNKKEDSDYILMNRKFYNHVKIKKYVTYNSDDFIAISDHFPIFIEIKF
jgi:endonuclease/exonuclease/phosphatase family metal-dependent hydrolase